MVANIDSTRLDLVCVACCVHSPEFAALRQRSKSISGVAPNYHLLLPPPKQPNSDRATGIHLSNGPVGGRFVSTLVRGGFLIPAYLYLLDPSK